MAETKVTPNEAEDFGFVEIARTTLGSAGDTITVSNIPTRKYLMIKYAALGTGAMNLSIRFNNDSGGNYAWRYSSNGGADTTGGTQTAIYANAGSYPLVGTLELLNIATTDKAGTGAYVAFNAGASSNIPGRTEIAIRWVNTTDAITRVDLINAGAGDMAIGSEVVVYGHN